MTYTFRNDKPDEFIPIIQEVGQWLIDSGQTMWGPGTLTADNLIGDYTRGNCWVMYADAVAAATFILQWEDPLYYPDVPPNTVGLIHKVAIRRQFAGQNLFQPILDFCKRECLKRGINTIQLETDATRPALLRFYERNGFTPTYEKQISEFGQQFLCQYYELDF